ncbi:hypothetical protein [Marinicauda algicola]|nr:hypothetical protein [Marinicauda algicola]
MTAMSPLDLCGIHGAGDPAPALPCAQRVATITVTITTLLPNGGRYGTG